MYWETLPDWFWILYYLFLSASLGTAIIRFIRLKVWSVLTITAAISIPIIGIINSIERAEGMNEYDHLVIHLQQGSTWAIYILIATLYLLVWWGLFLASTKNKRTLK